MTRKTKFKIDLSLVLISSEAKPSWSQLYTGSSELSASLKGFSVLLFAPDFIVN
jgi:hypothetical protein